MDLSRYKVVGPLALCLGVAACGTEEPVAPVVEDTVVVVPEPLQGAELAAELALIEDAPKVETVSVKQIMRDMKMKPVWRRTLHQGYLLAKVSINENTRPLRNRDASPPGTAGEVTDDTHGIAAVVVNNQYRLYGRRAKLGRRVANWAEVLGELAPHVTGVVPPKKRADGKWKQHHWTRNLPEEGCAKPEGFPEKGDWRLYADNWCKFRDKVKRMWVNRLFRTVPGRPITWGNDEDLERSLKLGRCKIEGLGDRNHFIALPGNCKISNKATNEENYGKDRNETTAGVLDSGLEEPDAPELRSN